jgi:hypothetical protein
MLTTTPPEPTGIDDMSNIGQLSPCGIDYVWMSQRNILYMVSVITVLVRPFLSFNFKMVGGLIINVPAFSLNLYGQ